MSRLWIVVVAAVLSATCRQPAGSGDAPPGPVPQHPAATSPPVATATVQQGVLRRGDLTAAELKYGRAPQRHPSVTYAPDVVLVDGGAEIVRALRPERLTCVIDGRASHAGGLAVGKIAFVTGRCVGRILHLQREGDDLSLVLGPVELTDIYRRLQVQFEQEIDLADVVPTQQQVEGTMFPLERDDAALPEWTVEVPRITPSRSAIPPPVFVRPARWRNAEVQNAPASPGIVQRLDLSDPTKFLNDAHGVGAELRHEGNGIRVVAQAQVRLARPRIDFHLNIADGHVVGRMILKNAASLWLAFNAATDHGQFAGDVNWRMPGPGFSIPIAGPAPLAFEVRNDIWVRTAFSSKATKFSTAGEYELNGDMGIAFRDFYFMTTGPKGLKVKHSVMRNMSNVSFGPSGFVLAYEMSLTAGVGVAGFTAGPTFGLAMSLGVAQGSSVGVIQCQGATLNMLGRGGVGWTIPQWVTKVVNFFLRLIRVETIPDHGGRFTDWLQLFSPVSAETDSPICRGGSA